MLSKMVKSLLLAFSAFLFVGCAQNIPSFQDRSKYPEIVYPRYNTNKLYNISAKKEGDHVCVTDEQFKGITKKMVDMKYQIVILQSILDDYNRWAIAQNKKAR